MITDLQPIAATTDYSPILDQLAALSRNLLLAFRLEVGKLMLSEYFGGSAHAYRDHDPAKPSSFNDFARTCQAELEGFGLSATVLRQCILARVAWDGLPPGVRDQLKFSQVVQLARVDEPNMRARLAFDATQQQWNVAQLRDAIARAGDHRYYDTDPTTPGTQPPPAELDEASYQPGRLVTQLVKAGKELQDWEAAWSTVAGKKLRGAQRQRLHDALATLKAQVARLEAQLGAAE